MKTNLTIFDKIFTQFDNFHILNFKLVNYFRNSEKFPGAVLPFSLIFSYHTVSLLLKLTTAVKSGLTSSWVNIATGDHKQYYTYLATIGQNMVVVLWGMAAFSILFHIFPLPTFGHFMSTGSYKTWNLNFIRTVCLK